MSQFWQGFTAGSLPANVATSYVEDSGTAIPALNILKVLANETNVNNDNGIQTVGSGNTVTVQLTNRITGAVTTTNATPTTVVSLSLGAVAGTYYVTGDIVAYNVTDAAGAAYSFSGAATTDGATATELGSDEKDIFEAAAMITCDFNIGVTGNTAYLEVIGIAGKTIDWSCLLTYRYIG